MKLWVDVLLVGVAGFFGAVTRFLVGHFAMAWLGKPRFPVGTFLINLSASFLLGLFFAYADRHVHQVDERLRLMVATGFIGTYSTFSTLMWEVDAGWQARQYWLAAGYLALSIVLGLASVRLGVWTGKVL